MKINVLSKDTIGNIFELVTNINKTSNLTASVLHERNKEGYYIIRIESLEG
ncbi:hypothetical protein [Clostridium sp. CTA-6]